jgi:hypothetical protein
MPSLGAVPGFIEDVWKFLACIFHSFLPFFFILQFYELSAVANYPLRQKAGEPNYFLTLVVALLHLTALSQKI